MVNKFKNIKSNLCQIRLRINIPYSLNSHLWQIWNLRSPVQDRYCLQALVNAWRDGSANGTANTAGGVRALPQSRTAPRGPARPGKLPHAGGKGSRAIGHAR